MSRAPFRLGRWGMAAWGVALACGSPRPVPELAPSVVAAPQVTSTSAALAPLVEEVEPSLPELRTGRIAPVEHSEPLALKVRRHALDGEHQVVELVLPEFASEAPGDQFWSGTEARLTGRSAALQLVSRGQGSELVLWLRRPKAEATGEIAGDAYTRSRGAHPGHHFRFRALAPSGEVSRQLTSAWASAASAYLASQPGAFGTFAATRLHTRYRLPGTPAPLQPGSHPSELVELMDTFSGRAAVQEALATHRGRVFAAARLPRTLPIASLAGPSLARHPWAELSKRLGVKPVDEPLALAVPADFYFVRSRSFGGFTDALDVVQSFGAPAADLLDGSASERGSLSRYLAELGVETSDLSRVLGPEVVRDFAVTGSDPYIHEGSDVTLVFRLKSPLLFRAALLKALAAHGAAHGGTQATSFTHEGVVVDVARSPDGRVRQHRAVVGEFELVSNSPAAVRRVISAALGKAPRLADEPDFRYMLARDANVPAEVLGFIGDRFVASVVGPALKIAEARRQVALAELSAQPFSALLFGWVYGRSPADRKELLNSALLQPADLKHQDGARIDWEPNRAPRSVWGSPATLEPLLDLPAVTRVSTAERDAYLAFAQQYTDRWSEYIDPVALRLVASHAGDGTSLHAELRVLPLVPRQNADLIDAVGEGRVDPPELPSGARFSLGIGKDSQLREAAGKALRFLPSLGGPKLELDWLGDYAVVGFADRAELAIAARMAREVRELPIDRPASAAELGRDFGSSEARARALAGLPVYLVIGLQSRVAAAVALTAIRRMAESTAPGALEWGPFAQHRGIDVVRVVAREESQDVTLYYALTADRLIVALNQSVMRSLIDQAVEGHLPQAGSKGADLGRLGQAVFELAPLKKGALRSLLSWGLSLSALETTPTARAAAEAVLRGVPESAHDADRSAELARAYFGVSPLTPDGRRYRLLPDGVADPLRGTLHAPEWPRLPTPESAPDRLVSALLRLRSDLAFEDEPELSGGGRRLRSLRARVDLRLR